MAAHQQLPGVPRLLRRTLPLRQRHRLPALRLAGGAGGFGPNTIGCSNGSYVTAPASCPAGTTTTGGPLLFYLQSSSPDGIARDAAGASDINNEELSLFIQDKWQAGHGLTIDYGFRWDAQLMPKTVDPKTTVYAPFLNDPRFPSDGTIPDQWKQFQPRGGFAWDIGQTGKTVLRGSAGLYYARQNMLSQVGSVTTNGIEQKSDFRSSGSSATCRCGRTCCRRLRSPPAPSRSSPESASSTATIRTPASSAPTSDSSAS